MKEEKQNSKSLSVIASTKEIEGIKVWPVSFGAIIWLRDVRKNKLLHGESPTEIDLAEVCFAFANNPLELSSMTKATIDKGVNDLLYGNSVKTLSALMTYCNNQLLDHINSIVVPKKKVQKGQPLNKTKTQKQPRKTKLTHA
jgi:hypothetical protein